MNRKGVIAIVGIIIIIVGGIFFIGNDDSVQVQDTSIDTPDEGDVVSSVPAYLISPTLQNEGAVAVIDFVTLAESGYVVVHRATEDNTPGSVIGNSDLLSEGSAQNITIDLSEDIADGDVLYFMLHRDDGNGIYEFPGPDVPITTSDSQLITTRVVVGIEGGLVVTEKETEVVESEEVTEEGTQTIVMYTDKGFSPETIEIENGQTVRWVNDSSQNLWVASAVHPTHTLYPQKADSDCLGSSFDACTGIAPGSSFEFTFNESGSWTYHNHLSIDKIGTVNVD
ncbi:hypothetical protein IID27_02720 [Patescibacteria group bacterium]|nr:hypothetical protein [Patescibacteria group bacterium]MCH8847283.1 hypothetical protein [Pseudomonadota bacterium]